LVSASLHKTKSAQSMKAFIGRRLHCHLHHRTLLWVPAVDGAGANKAVRITMEGISESTGQAFRIVVGTPKVDADRAVSPATVDTEVDTIVHCRHEGGLDSEICLP